MALKLSFIIPVYNVEAYLKECLESILHQATNECEVILVDDGSTDNSSAICDEYAKSFAMVSAIHRRNGGLASARNVGAENARGEYIAFVDSDDRIAPNSVVDILDWISSQGTDVCFMDAEKFYPNGKTEGLGDRIEPAHIRGIAKEGVFAYLATRPKYPGSACTKLYKRSFLVENGLVFQENGRYSEDLGFVLDCLLTAKSFDALSMPYYEYRQRRVGSITFTATKKSFDGMAAFVTESVEKLTKNNQPKEEISKCAMAFVAYEYSIMLWQFSCLKKTEKEKALAFLCEYSWVMKYGASKKTKAIWAMTKILGLQITSKILNVYMSLR